MKYDLKINLLFFMQYAVVIFLWYWFFDDALWIRLAAGLASILYSLLMLLRTDLFPNRHSLMGKLHSEKLFNRNKKFTSWIGVPIGLMILLGYRATTYRVYGITALVILLPLIIIYISGLFSEDGSWKARFSVRVIFSLFIMLIFSMIPIMLIYKGDGTIKMFSEYSPYPMMILYSIAGIVHFFVLRKIERHFT